MKKLTCHPNESVEQVLYGSLPLPYPSLKSFPLLAQSQFIAGRDF
jgi:hypothetical protein